MKLIDGPKFNMSKPEIIIDYLKSIDKRIITINASNLNITVDKEELKLNIFNDTKNQYPIRISFLFKLLKWYGVGYFHLNKYSINTMVAICNDHLKSIAKGFNKVQIKIENGEAVSIVSDNFTYISDLEVIESVEKFGISTISRDDFILRIYTEKKAEKAPVVDDLCGFGFNITNSETGFSALKAEHFILRYVCTNGAVAQISSKNNTNVAHYNQNKQTLLNNLIDSLESSSNVPENFIAAVQLATKMSVKKSFPNITYKVHNILGPSKSYKFFDEFNQIDSNEYDLFNYITHKAKNFNLLERYNLEQLATNHLLSN